MNVLTYCENTDLLKQEMKDKGFYDEETKSFNVGYAHTPIKHTPDKLKSLGYSIIKERDEQGNLVSPFDNLEILGAYDEVFADDVKHDKYKSVYDYLTPIEYIDEDGVVQTYSLPQRLGEFA